MCLSLSRTLGLLTSIDFSKAFNHLDFKHCLNTLRNKGVSSSIIRVIAPFLTNRKMMVTIGNVFSNPREVLGGVPQCSITGVFLFNCSIHSFGSSSTDVPDYCGATGVDTAEDGGP